jgi:hypothetical protein
MGIQQEYGIVRVVGSFLRRLYPAVDRSVKFFQNEGSNILVIQCVY